jgi:hypothetical protein
MRCGGVEAVEETEWVERMEGVLRVGDMEGMEEWKEWKKQKKWKKGRMEEGLGPLRTNQEKGSYDNAQTSLSPLPASPSRNLALRLSKSRQEAEGYCQGDWIQRVTRIPHPLLARFPTGI